MLKSKTDVVRGEARPFMRDYAMLVIGMSAAIATTLAVIGGTIVGA